MPESVKRRGSSGPTTGANDRGIVVGHAITGELIDTAGGDLFRVMPIVLVALVLILAIYLRALLAPLYLVLLAALAPAAARVLRWDQDSVRRQGGPRSTPADRTEVDKV